MLKIDSHQHFWQYDAKKHQWISDEMKVLRNNFLPEDLKPELDKAGFDGCVAVQADQSLDETEFLLNLSDHYNFIKGVVGWVDLRSSDLEQQLRQYTEHNKLKGIRHIVQDEPDDKFLLQPDFIEGVKQLKNYDLTYDILIFARHLPVANEFLTHFDDQKFVLDHIAKPEIKNGNIDEWAMGIREMAEYPHIYCKVSGIVTEADWEHWSAKEIRPYLDVVFDAFGPDRLMFGSDWPVCTLAASYQDVFKLIKNYISDYSQDEQDAILGENAADIYGIPLD